MFIFINLCSLSQGWQPGVRGGREELFELAVELVVGHAGQAVARSGHFFAAPQVLLDAFDGGPGSVVLGHGWRRRRRRSAGQHGRSRARRDRRLSGRDRCCPRGIEREHPDPVAFRVDGPAPVPAVSPHRRRRRRIARVACGAGRPHRRSALLAGPVQRRRRITSRRRLLRRLRCGRRRRQTIFLDGVIDCGGDVIVVVVVVVSVDDVVVVVAVGGVVVDSFAFGLPLFRGRESQSGRLTAATAIAATESRTRRGPARDPEQRQTGVAHGQPEQVEHVVQQRLFHLVVHVAIVAQRRT